MLSLARVASCLIAAVMLITPAPAFPQTAPAPKPAKVEAEAAPKQRPPGLLAALSATGYSDLTVDDIVHLKNNGVGPDFLYELHDLGIARMPPGDLVRLRQHNVKPSYLRDALAFHPGLGVDDVIEFQNNGVKAGLLSAIRSLGYGPYTPREVVQMSQHGVDSDFFHALQEYGIRQAASAEVIRARDHGVGPAAFRAARQYGSRLTLSQITKLKSAGVF
jgi:hypothetical protein